MRIKYYFAGCMLHINGKLPTLVSERLNNFADEMPFRCEIELRLSGVAPKAEKAAFITEASGVKISKINENNWLFSSSVAVNGCHLEAADDYSKLQLFSDYTQCTDEQLLCDNFMQLLRLAVECRLSYFGAISLHASCVCHEGQAVLFTAPSGTGKSTQASLWQENFGAKILSGDRPNLHLTTVGVGVYGVPWDGKEQIFLQEDYPVRAMVEVRQAKTNYLREMSEDQSFKVLMRQCLIPMWDDSAKFRVFKTVRELSRRVRFCRLFCLPDGEAAELTKNVLYEGQNNFVREVQSDMKIKEGFILRNIVDEWIVMPTGSNIKDFEGAIVLNEVSAFIWKKLESAISREDLLKAITDEYDIDEQAAANDLDEFLGRLEEMSFLN